jgi:hypothetical protein
MSAASGQVIPDRVRADLRQHEQDLEAGAGVWASCAPRALAELRDLLLQIPTAPGAAARASTEPSIHTTADLLFDDLPDALGEDYGAFLRALANGDGRNDSELGRIVRLAAERAGDRYVKSFNGQHWIANRVTSMQHEQED